MKARTAVPFVDSNVIPDRNAGIGSLLWDLQHPRDPDSDGPPLLDREFAFIDVGVSRAAASIALKTLLAGGLGMAVDYVATERPEAVPYAHVTLLGDRAEKIRRCLSRMISSQKTAREVDDWHYVIDLEGKVSSIGYSYNLYGNEVWEAYFMGRPFMHSGEPVGFSDPQLDEMLAPFVSYVEAGIYLEMKRDRDPVFPGPSWAGYRLERNPLVADLAGVGITLQKVSVPRRIKGRQNVLFLGNVLNHYPRGEQGGEFERIAASMEPRDIVIVQADETEASFVDVLQVTGQGGRNTRERVRWIDTRKLEVRTPVRGQESWRLVSLKPELERLINRLVDGTGKTVASPEWSQEKHKALVRQYFGLVFRAFFRAMPVEETLRVAVREVLRRLPAEGGPKEIPVSETSPKTR